LRSFALQVFPSRNSYPQFSFKKTIYEILITYEKHKEVDALHIALQKSGFSINAHELAGHVADNGDFGESTASAVSGFQQKYADEILTPLGLKYGIGYVGGSTRKKLNSLYGCGTTNNQPPVISGVSGPTTFIAKFSRN